jgi:hypothetical protein
MVSISRTAARQLYNRLVEEAHAIQLLLRSTDQGMATGPPAHVAAFLRMQTGVLVSQRDTMLQQLGDITTLAAQHGGIFTAGAMASWTAFAAAVDALQAVQVANNTVGNWVEARELITALFCVDLAPLEAPQQGGAPDGDGDQNGGQRDPDAAFVCHEPVRARIVAAGTGHDVALGQKSIMVFIVENYVKPHEAFTRDKDEDSIKEL